MSSSGIRDLLTSFSPSLDFLAITTGDGRIKIWDTLKGQVQTEFADIVSTDATDLYLKPERGHLSIDYTCMLWMSMERKKKRKHVFSLLLLGTGSGDVLALDVSAGELKWRVSDCHPGGVTAVSFSKHGSCIYSAGADGMICKIDPMSGGLLGKFKASTKAISSMSVSPDGKLLATAASQLKIFNCTDQKKIQKFSGHPGAVRCMIFTEDGKHVFSSSAGERYVAIWQIDGSKKKSATCVLAMEHPAVYLDCRCNSNAEADSNLHVLAISEIGVCYLWNGKDIDELRSTKPTKISSSLPDNFSKIHRGVAPTIFAGKLQGFMKPASCHVFVAYGLLVKPSFERLFVQIGNDIHLHSSQDGVLLPYQSHKPKKKTGSHSGVTALDRANAEDAMLPIPKIYEFQNKKSRHQSIGTDIDKVLSDGIVTSVGDMDMDEPNKLCIEDKLRSLGILSNKDDVASNLTFNSTLSKGINLQENVPQKKMKATVLSMEPWDALKQLKDLVAMWHARSCSGKYVLPWIYTILVNHSHYVASQEPAIQVLESLCKITQSKRSDIQSLLRTSGCLNLVATQIGKAVQSKTENFGQDLHTGSKEDESEDEEDDIDDVLYGLDDDVESQSSSDGIN